MKFGAVAAALALTASSAARADDVVVERHPSTAGIVAADTLYGGIGGAAVGGGIILYNMGIQDNTRYDWGRTLAISTAVGLGVGLVWGIVDAANAQAYPALRQPVTDGQSWQAQHPFDQSGTSIVPLEVGRW